METLAAWQFFCRAAALAPLLGVLGPLPAAAQAPQAHPVIPGSLHKCKAAQIEVLSEVVPESWTGC